MAHRIYPRDLPAGANVGEHLSDGYGADFDLITEQIELIQESGADEFLFVVAPATKDITVADSTTARKARVSVVDSYGRVHKWFSGAVNTTISTDSVSGTVPDVTSIDLVEGEGQIDVAPSGTFLADETITIAADAQSILGMSVLAAQAVWTIIANP